MVTESGESWVSDTLERKALQILLALLPALLAEFLLLLVFQLDWRRNWKVFLVVNLITQEILSSVLGILVVRDGFISQWMRLYLGAAIVIAFVEAFLYRRFFRGPTKQSAFTNGLAANAASAIPGWFMVDFAWYMAVSIS